MAKAGHNSGQDPMNVTGDELRNYIESFERLESDKKSITEEQKELMAEAKGRGFDTKVMRKIMALRKRKAEEVAEEQAILELYMSVLGMDFSPEMLDPLQKTRDEDEEPEESLV